MNPNGLSFAGELTEDASRRSLAKDIVLSLGVPGITTAVADVVVSGTFGDDFAGATNACVVAGFGSGSGAFVGVFGTGKIFEGLSLIHI